MTPAEGITNRAAAAAKQRTAAGKYIIRQRRISYCASDISLKSAAKRDIICSINKNLEKIDKMQHNVEFWNALDELVNNSEIIIDRPKGTSHPKYPDFIYRVDYGYLKDTTSMDGAGIEVWVGSDEKKVDAIMCIVDLMKKDSEIKILIGCTEEEKEIVYETHNETPFMKGVLIRR